MNMFRVVSLFAGCGGAELGLLGGFVFNGVMYDKLPFKLVYALDINEKAINTHKLNFKCDNVVIGDICDIHENTIPDCDVVVGGFPCQSFSVANPTKDPFDDRANLYKEMVRIVNAKQPMVFIAENVKGFMRLHNGTIFNRVIAAFDEVGYRTYSTLLNAADYGVPQKRERVFMVGVRKDIVVEYDFPKPTTKENPVPLSAAVPNLKIEEKKYYFSEKAVEGMKRARARKRSGIYQNLNEPCLTVTSHLAKASLNSYDPVLLVDPSKELYRRFTPREAARIQSFPDDFIFAGGDLDAYRQIGNAIAPVKFWHIAKSISVLLEAAK